MVAMDGAEVISVLNDRSASLLAAVAEDLDACDGYVVLVFDPETGELDAHGPYEGVGATLRADAMRQEFDGDGLRDVVVRITRLHDPR